MGVNNRQRRAAKQRKRQRSGRARQERFQDQTQDPFQAHAQAELSVSAAVRSVARHKLDDADLLRRAVALEHQVRPRDLLGTVLADVLARVVEEVAAGGWGPADLRQVVRRGAGARHLPTLAAAAADDRPLRLSTTDQVASALGVAGLLSTVPLMVAGSAATRLRAGATEVDHPKLAKVRALLAKAESTEFDDEAEALTAKAQELISRYALGRLVDAARSEATGAGEPVIRRIWLDAPYVRAKTALVGAVADANRCRAAASEQFGFSIVVGDPADLDAVELLVTSLLVQADTAMLRLGRRNDRYGTSRTRSFRSSFLFAYAARIGERLRAASEDAVAAEGGGGLLPVLLDHEKRVTGAFDAMVPHTTGRGASIGNGEGWYAGLAAADLALLDVHGKLTDQAG